jgi:hypothetical protein
MARQKSRQCAHCRRRCRRLRERAAIQKFGRQAPDAVGRTSICRLATTAAERRITRLQLSLAALLAPTYLLTGIPARCFQEIPDDLPVFGDVDADLPAARWTQSSRHDGQTTIADLLQERTFG